MTGARQKQVKAKAVRAFKMTKNLNEAAQKKLDEKADEIVDSLCQKTIDGNTQCGRLLVELAQRNEKAEEATKPKPFRSFALELASEPEWRDEQLTAASTAKVGSRKPKAA